MEGLAGLLEIHCSQCREQSSSKSEEVGRKVTPEHKSLLSVEDQLLLTWMCLRLGWRKQELVGQFGTSRSAVALSHGSMYLHLGLLPIWPHRTKVQSSICPPSLPSPTRSPFLSWTQRSCAVNHLPPYLVSPSYKCHTTLNRLVGIAHNFPGNFINDPSK